MARYSDIETVEMRYLLGKLPEDQRTSFEDRIFADDEAFEELEIVEEELLDAYVRGELSAGDHDRFHKQLAGSPRLKERAQFARMLTQSITSLPQTLAPEPAYASSSSREPAAPSWWNRFSFNPFSSQPLSRMVLAAAMVLILVGGAGLMIGWLKLRSESARLANERTTLEQQTRERERQAAEQQSRHDELTAELQKERAERAEREQLIAELQSTPSERTQIKPRNAIAFLFLLPGATRGSSGTQDLSLSDSTALVRFRLALEANDYTRYAVELRTPSGNEVLRKDGLKAQSSGSVHTLFLEFPAAKLSSGNYQVRVSGVTAAGNVESVSDYTFRVVKH